MSDARTLHEEEPAPEIHKQFVGIIEQIKKLSIPSLQQYNAFNLSQTFIKAINATDSLEALTILLQQKLTNKTNDFYINVYGAIYFQLLQFDQEELATKIKIFVLDSGIPLQYFYLTFCKRAIELNGKSFLKNGLDEAQEMGDDDAHFYHSLLNNALELNHFSLLKQIVVLAIKRNAYHSFLFDNLITILIAKERITLANEFFKIAVKCDCINDDRFIAGLEWRLKHNTQRQASWAYPRLDKFLKDKKIENEHGVEINADGLTFAVIYFALQQFCSDPQQKDKSISFKGNAFTKSLCEHVMQKFKADQPGFIVRATSSENNATHMVQFNCRQLISRRYSVQRQVWAKENNDKALVLEPPHSYNNRL